MKMLRGLKVNNSETETLSMADKLALARFAKQNNLPITTVINRVLSKTINSGALKQAIATPIKGTVNVYSKNH